MTYTYYACIATSGVAVKQLPLTSFSGEVSLVGGSMSAEMFLGHLTVADATDMLRFTTPGKYTIAVDHDGTCVGEWFIWQRSRTNDSGTIKLVGAELVSYMNRRLMHIQSYTDIDQLTLANELAVQCFLSADGHRAPKDWESINVGRNVTLTVATEGATSGILVSHDYDNAAMTHGAAIAELASTDSFDYAIGQVWTGSGATRTCVRTFSTYSPKAGTDRTSTVLAMATTVGTSTGNIVTIDLDEDASVLDDQIYALGGTSPTTGGKLNASNSDDSHPLTFAGGYPYFQASISQTDVTTSLDLLAALADAEWVKHQTAQLPPQLTILADTGTRPGHGMSLGDLFGVAIDVSQNFPTGYYGIVRVIGWTINPPASGREFLKLSVSGGNE